ncbi:MAG: glycosyltransferase [Candidatus Moranbacteria bacterium]|nr:glycosyltransferase [Candidatus Moranbacteria bacterium]
MNSNNPDKKPILSIIIVSWNGEKVIKKCLDSLLKQKNVFFELIIVDNASRDSTIEIINQKQNKFGKKFIKLIQNQKNLGFPKANNQGIKKATGKYILFLNQDIIVKDGVLSKMIEAFEKAKKQVGAVAPKLVYPNGNLQKSLRPFPTPFNVLWDILTGGRWHENYYSYDKKQFVDQPMASCLMIKTQIIREINGFDQSKEFFLYFNDADLSYRIHKKNFKHLFIPKIKVIHFHGKSARTWKEVKRIKAWTKGLYYFLTKHYSKDNIVFVLLIKVEVFMIFILRLGAAFIKEALKNSTRRVIFFKK